MRSLPSGATPTSPFTSTSVTSHGPSRFRYACLCYPGGLGAIPSPHFCLFHPPRARLEKQIGWTSEALFMSKVYFFQRGQTNFFFNIFLQIILPSFFVFVAAHLFHTPDCRTVVGRDVEGRLIYRAVPIIVFYSTPWQTIVYLWAGRLEPLKPLQESDKVSLFPARLDESPISSFPKGANRLIASKKMGKTQTVFSKGNWRFGWRCYESAPSKETGTIPQCFHCLTNDSIDPPSMS